MIKFKLNQKIKLEAWSNNKIPLTGVIVGTGSIFKTEEEIQSVYLVKLDLGFYDPTAATFVSILVADISSISLIE